MSLISQNKQRQIMTTAYQDHQKVMNSYAAFKMSDRVMGQDLVQDAFLKTWKYLIKGGKIDIMKSFLYKVLNNLVVDEYRKHKSSSLDTLLEKGFEPAVENPAHSTGADKTFDEIDGKIVFALIRRLPIKYQQIMLMKFKRDLSIKEISSLTGETNNAVTVQVHRGLAKLRVLFEGGNSSV